MALAFLFSSSAERAGSNCINQERHFSEGFPGEAVESRPGSRWRDLVVHSGGIPQWLGRPRRARWRPRCQPLLSGSGRRAAPSRNPARKILPPVPADYVQYPPQTIAVRVFRSSRSIDLRSSSMADESNDVASGKLRPGDGGLRHRVPEALCRRGHRSRTCLSFSRLMGLLR